MTRKTSFHDGWSWFKFNKLGLTLGTNLKFLASVPKGLKLKVKVRKFWGLTPTFVEVAGEKLVRVGPFCPSPPQQSWIGLRRKSSKSTKGLAIFDFLLQCDSPISFDDFCILASNSSKFKKRIKESLDITRDKPVLNRTASHFPWIFLTRY